MGQRDLRRLPVAGAIAVIRWAFRLGADDPRLATMTNKMARTVRAVATKKELFRASVSACETSGGWARESMGREK